MWEGEGKGAGVLSRSGRVIGCILVARTIKAVGIISTQSNYHKVYVSSEYIFTPIVNL